MQRCTPARDCERPALSVRFRPRDVCGRGARGAIKAAPRAWRAPLPPEHSSATGGKKVCASLLLWPQARKRACSGTRATPCKASIYIHAAHLGGNPVRPRTAAAAAPWREARRSARANDPVHFLFHFAIKLGSQHVFSLRPLRQPLVELRSPLGRGRACMHSRGEGAQVRAMIDQAERR